MISKTEWEQVHESRERRELLIERETGDFLAKGGKIIKAKEGETGLVYFPGRGYISKDKANALEDTANAIKEGKAKAAAFVGDLKGAAHFQSLSTADALKFA